MHRIVEAVAGKIGRSIEPSLRHPVRYANIPGRAARVYIGRHLKGAMKPETAQRGTSIQAGACARPRQREVGVHFGR